MSKSKVPAPPEPEPKKDPIPPDAAQPERWKVQRILSADQVTLKSAREAFDTWAAYMYPIFRSGYIAASDDIHRAQSQAKTAWVATYTPTTGTTASDEFKAAK